MPPKTLNPTAAAWQPPVSADTTSNNSSSMPLHPGAPDSAHGASSGVPTPQHTFANPDHVAPFVPPQHDVGGDGYDYGDDDCDDDIDPDHYEWAAQQAELAEQRMMEMQQWGHVSAQPPVSVTVGHRAPGPAPRADAKPFNPPPARPHAPIAPSVYEDSIAPESSASYIQVGVSAPKVSGKDRRRNYAKEAAKQKQREAIAVKSGLEAFSSALLHSTSPFMAPLRNATGSSLPHIKVDQRFGKRGQPHTAVMQFVIAPLVNYRPAHFHDLAPGDVMEFHHDLALVLKAIKTASSLCISYGDTWKPFALPYAYLSCSDYHAEVLRLCPDEVPNARADAVYADDVMKDVTPLILAVPELEALHRKSIVQAMKSRVNLYPLYAIFASLFSGIADYQIQIRDLHAVPPTFLLKTSTTALKASPQPIVVAGDKDLWDLLKTVPSTFSSTGMSTAAVPSAPAAGATTGAGAASQAAVAPPTTMPQPRRDAVAPPGPDDDAEDRAAERRLRLIVTGAVVAVGICAAGVAALLLSDRGGTKRRDN